MSEKLSSNDTKDRLEEFKDKNVLSISEMIQSLIEQDPFDGHPFYIFAHKRTIGMDERLQIFMENNGVLPFEKIPDVKILWQTRLTKPLSQENSMLYKVDPKKPDQIKIIWILPEREKFHLYEKGKFFQDQITAESIYNFIHNRDKLEAPDPDDLDDERIRNIYYSKIFTGANPYIGSVFRKTFKRVN